MIFGLLKFLLASSVVLATEPKFSGLNASAITQLRHDLPHVFQGDFTYEEADEIIRHLLATGLYEKVQSLVDDQNQVHIQVQPFHTLKEIKISGQSKFSDSELNKLLDLKQGERFDRQAILLATEKIKQTYGESGYFNAIVEVNFEKLADEQVNVLINVNEGSPCVLRDMVIESSNRELNERLLGLRRLGKHPLLNTNEINKLRSKWEEFLLNHRYLKTELIGPEIRYNNAEKTEAHLIWRLTEPFRYDFLAFGNKQFTDLQVYNSMSLDTLEKGLSDPMGEVTGRIKNSYYRAGFANVDIETEVSDDLATFVRKIRLNISENERVRVNKIVISGRLSRDDIYYIDFIKNNSSRILRQGYYNKADYEIIFESLTNELHNQGYLRAKIQSSRLDYIEGKDKANLVIVIDEGPLTQIRTINYAGITAFSAHELNQHISVKPNSPLRLKNLEKSLDELKKFYQSQGYLEMRLLNESETLVQYNDRGTQADINYEIFEGPKVVIKSIHIEGNTFTKDDVILRTISLEPGQILTPELIEENEIRLNRLSIFSRASIRTAEENTNVSQRIVVIAVSEKDPATFKVGAGVNSERDLTLRGYMGYSHNNLWGSGRAISVRGEIKSHVIEKNYPQHEIVLGYLEPFLFGGRNKGKVSVTRSEKIFQTQTKFDLTQITTSNKLDFFLERDITRNTRLTWKVWSMDARREFELEDRCADNPNNKCQPEVLQIATIGPNLDIDRRDNPFMPTTGSYTNWTADFSDRWLGSSAGVNFIRTEGNHTQYLPLGSTNRYVWANSVRGGYVTNLSERPGSGVPVSQAFFLGGISTLRGFGGTKDIERLPPGWLLPVKKSTEKIINEDSYYYLIKSELRFTLFEEHGAVVFYDGGLVQVTGVKFDRPYRDAIGVGYRYNTPVGPLSVDIGFKISPRNDIHGKEDKYRVHFSFGTF